MKLAETCPCGAQIDFTYAIDTLGSSRRDRDLEVNEAHKQLDTWRRAHKPCLKRLGETPEPIGFAPGPELDAHDDETERRLLARLERQQLLAHGLTATDARAALDG